MADIDDCPDLSGTYFNRAAEPQNPTHFGYLFDELTREGALGTHECVYCAVEVQQSDGKNVRLKVSLTDYGDILRKPSFITEYLSEENDDFRCENGRLVISYFAFVEGVIEGAYVGGERVFVKGADGSVMRRDIYDVGGHWLIIPMHHRNYTDYARWVTVDLSLTDPAGLAVDQQIDVIVDNVDMARDLGLLRDRDNLGIPGPNTLVAFLKAAKKRLAQGDQKGACDFLSEAHRLVDSQSLPEGAVTGSGRAEVAGQISALQMAIGCAQ